MAAGINVQCACRRIGIICISFQRIKTLHCWPYTCSFAPTHPDRQCSLVLVIAGRSIVAVPLRLHQTFQKYSTMKKIILTGSSSGFGILTAKTLASQGHTVYATMRGVNTSNLAAATALKEWASANNAVIEIVELDVTDNVSVQKAIATITKHSGGVIDVLINNAGAAFIGLNETLSADQTGQLFQINVIGVDRMIKAVLPFMHRQKDGLLITLSSVASRQPIPVMGAYGASKAAVDALSASYYYELRSSGIDVVIVQPGAYPSTDIVVKQPIPANPMAEELYGEDMLLFKKSVIKTFTPTGENPDPQEVADQIASLIKTPRGERELWSIVRGGPLTESIHHINQSTRKIVDTILDAVGV